MADRPARPPGEVAPPDDLPAAVYAFAFAAYVALGYVLKSVVLNWLVGPLFLVVVLYVVPSSLVRVRSRWRARPRR